MVTDFTGLNKYVKRPIHPFPSVDVIKNRIPASAKVFCKLDATKGYWQIDLDEGSRDLTTFITPYGRFRYCRAPIGLSSSSDEFCRRTDEAINGVGNVMKIVDDMISWAPDLDSLEPIIERILTSCEAAGIQLSPDKMVIGEEVSFAGLIISSQGIKPDPKKLKAISEFPSPTNITELRSFLGLVNQLIQFTPNLAVNCAPLRTLLKKNVPYEWTAEHEKAFLEAKSAISRPCLLNHYDTRRNTFILTDASKLNGLGYALFQEEGNEKFLIQCGSCSLSDVEKRYAPIELEAMAVAWAIKKCYLYLLGSEFTVITDHTPLKSIFEKCDSENLRIRRFLDKVAQFQFSVQWVPGKSHYIADALSRSPVSVLEEDFAVARQIDVDFDLTDFKKAAEQ